MNDDESLNQMPADFLVDASSGVVLAAKYGMRMYDRWTAEEVIMLAKQRNVEKADSSTNSSKQVHEQEEQQEFNAI
jgi:hypothetical protein